MIGPRPGTLGARAVEALQPAPPPRPGDLLDREVCVIAVLDDGLHENGHRRLRQLDAVLISAIDRP